MYASQIRIVKSGRKKNMVSGGLEITILILQVVYAKIIHSLPI